MRCSFENNANDMRTRVYRLAGGEIIFHSLRQGVAEGPYLQRTVKGHNCLQKLYDNWMGGGGCIADSCDVEFIVTASENIILSSAAQQMSSRAKALVQAKKLKQSEAQIDSMGALLL